jgi:serine/threonine protein phosphatase PrpC
MKNEKIEYVIKNKAPLTNKDKTSKKLLNFNKKKTSNSSLLESRIKDCAVKTIGGKSLSDPNKKNQDANFLLYQCFNGLGVMDDHGTNGHLISSFIENHYVANIEECTLNALNRSLKSLHTKNIFSAISSLEKNPMLGTETFIEAFKLTNEKLEHSSIDISCSGTTLNTVLILGSQLVRANVGDSRAIIGTWSNKGWSVRAISQDHKPDHPEEYERITKMNGRVERQKDSEGKAVGPARVWKKEKDVLGLAMSRSFGDKIAKEIGVICTPSIESISLNKNDKIMVVASDGVFDQLDTYRS